MKVIAKNGSLSSFHNLQELEKHNLILEVIFLAVACLKAEAAQKRRESHVLRAHAHRDKSLALHDAATQKAASVSQLETTQVDPSDARKLKRRHRCIL